MASALYKDHLILSTADLNVTTGKWTVTILRAWNPGPGPRWQFDSMQPPNQFDHRKEAEEFGIQVGKDWVDGRI